MNLSTHFTLEEFTSSETAARHGIDNTPSPQIVENLKRLAATMEDIRSLFGKPLIITSGFRCSKLNKQIGSKPTSAHVNGLACDFKIHGMTPHQVCDAIAKSGLSYDQCISEYGQWTHIGLAANNRKQLLTINQHGTFAGLVA